ncbi:MAG TPA: hypothetical protein VFC46_10520 [Humisphaera sp.]|nr:hypothetical protein [Humisphaera sp.]
MIDSISKPKLPKGVAYVLKTSQLAKALLDAGIDCHVDLVFWQPEGGESILEAHYWLPNRNVPHPRVYVRAGVAACDLRAAASEALLASALPRFITWLREILILPPGSPALHEEPYFNASYSEKGLAVTNQPTYKVPRRKR